MNKTNIINLINTKANMYTIIVSFIILVIVIFDMIYEFDE